MAVSAKKQLYVIENQKNFITPFRKLDFITINEKMFFEYALINF